MILFTFVWRRIIYIYNIQLWFIIMNLKDLNYYLESILKFSRIGQLEHFPINYVLN